MKLRCHSAVSLLNFNLFLKTVAISEEIWYYKHMEVYPMDNEFDEQRKIDLEYIKNFRLIDDDFMKLVFEDKECVQLLLRIVMDIPDLEVEYVKTEYTVHNVTGRGVRLDVFATDSSGKRYNIEIQREDKGAGRKRARFNSSMLDVNSLSPGEPHEQLPETYVIFITERDVLRKKLPIYHIERVIMETGELFDDKSHIIYVNSEIRDDTPLGMLMHDFKCTDAADIGYDILADRVKYFKETEKGVASMCRAMEEMRAAAAAEALKKGIALGKAEGRAEGKAEGKAEGRAEGKAEGIAEVVEKLRRSGMTDEAIQAALNS